LPTPSFADDLKRFGPRPPAGPPLSLRQARRYCRRLACRHYENFTVASHLLPRSLRQHFCNIYAYCRWADDLADEVHNPQQSLALLAWWENQLRQCYAGKVSHPVFMALAQTIETFQIPLDPFVDLLSAFRQDQRTVRYETFNELLNYCKYSANPVGRLVLYLGQCHTPERVRLADSICTGLQLANFCQDVARDWDRGRIYLPQVDCRRFGCDEAMFQSRFATQECQTGFQRLMTVYVDHADGWLRGGLPLVGLLPRELRMAVMLFVHGGLAILQEIRHQDYNVWAGRPVVSKIKKLQLLATCWWQLRRGTLLRSGVRSKP
jgi:squalene synthase HpnC